MPSGRWVVVTIAALCVTAGVRAQGTGEIRTRVLDESGAPVRDVQVELVPGSRRALSEDDGALVFTQVAPGSYTLQIRRIGYRPQSVRVDVAARASAAPAITLVAIPTVLDSIRVFEQANGLRYTGTVLDERSAPVEGAVVMVPGKARELRTDASGRFSVEGFGAGTVLARVRKIGYAPQLHTLRMMNSKADSIRLKRLAQTLSPVEVSAKSGFGKDTFVYRELDQRMRWKGERSYVVSRRNSISRERPTSRPRFATPSRAAATAAPSRIPCPMGASSSTENGHCGIGPSRRSTPTRSRPSRCIRRSPTRRARSMHEGAIPPSKFTSSGPGRTRSGSRRIRRPRNLFHASWVRDESSISAVNLLPAQRRQ